MFSLPDLIGVEVIKLAPSVSERACESLSEPGLTLNLILGGAELSDLFGVGPDDVDEWVVLGAWSDIDM